MAFDLNGIFIVITEFSELTATEVAQAINEMIDDGEFPVLAGMQVLSGGGLGQSIPNSELPLINGQSLAVIGRTVIIIPSYDIGTPACPQTVHGSFVSGSTTRFCNGSPVVTFASLGLVASAGPSDVHPTEALFTHIDVDDVVALP